MKYNILFTCVSHIGNCRSMNQDNFICNGKYMDSETIVFPLAGNVSSNSASIFGVFDGMGGEECGEIASYIAAKNAAALEMKNNTVAELSQFCQKTNTDICDYANKRELSAMGTTAAVLAFTKKGVTLCNIGDSKIFRFCDSVLEQISKDHVAVSAFGVKPPLSQNLGIPPTELVIDPYFAQGAYVDGDIYLICSDGLTDMVTSTEIADVLLSKSIDEASNELLNMALAGGGKDNITFILCKVSRESGWFFKRKHHARKKEV